MVFYKFSKIQFVVLLKLRLEFKILSSNYCEIFYFFYSIFQLFQLSSQIVSFASTSSENIFLVGTKTGVLAVAKITKESFSIIETMKVFKAPLTSIAIDPFSRAFLG